MHAAARMVRDDPDLGPTLRTTVDPATGTQVVGVATIADLVDATVPGGIATAPDGDVEAAADAVVERLGADSPVLGLSTQAVRADDGSWSSPAVTMTVLGDNDVLDFGANSVNLGGDTASC